MSFAQVETHEGGGGLGVARRQHWSGHVTFQCTLCIYVVLLSNSVRKFGWPRRFYINVGVIKNIEVS